MNPVASHWQSANIQADLIREFHLVRDHGMDIYNPHDSIDNVYLVDPPNYANAMANITKLLDEIIPKKRMVISRRQETSQGFIVRVANERTKAIEACTQLTERDFDGFNVDPDIQAVLDLNRDLGTSYLSGLPLNQTVNGKTVHQHYQDYLLELKRRFSTPLMKQYFRNRKVSEVRREKGITKAVQNTLGICKRARLIRIDGFYKQSERDAITARKIASDLDRFIGNMRNNKTQFEALALAVFKIEYGAKKGYHWHGYFIYDGTITRQDISRAMYLVDYWCTVITKGKGSGYNGNVTSNLNQLADKLSIPARSLAIGEYRIGDALQAENLRALIRYLSKSDQGIRVKGERRIQQLRIVHGPRYRELLRRRTKGTNKT